TLYDSIGTIMYVPTANQTLYIAGPGGKLMTTTSISTNMDGKGNPVGTIYDASGNIVDPDKLDPAMTVYDANGNQITTSQNINELTDAATQPLRQGKRIYLPTHHGDMVLRPEMAWSVPEPRAPVCTSLGQDPLVQPVFSSSSTLLLGTPLDQADNSVGTIMPKIEFREYIDLNTPAPLPRGVPTN
ncbi:MAG: hypothetical protein WCG87_12680, partial [Bacteroidota bacterium]